jgi:hypothetical protein
MKAYVTTLFVCSQPDAKMLPTRHRRHLLSQLPGKLPFSSFIAQKNCVSRSRSSEASLRQIHPEVDRASDLVQQFAQMLRTRTGERLDAWLAQVQCSNLASTSVLCCANASFMLCRKNKPSKSGASLPRARSDVKFESICGNPGL